MNQLFSFCKHILLSKNTNETKKNLLQILLYFKINFLVEKGKKTAYNQVFIFSMKNLSNKSIES